MSLIEQAAKRLEELQRAGATADEQQSPHADGAGDSFPTPEAIVRALEARRESPLDVAAAEAKAAQAVPAAAPLPASPAPRRMARVEAPLPKVEVPATKVDPAGPRPKARGVRTVSIDLPLLKSRGFVTPDAPTTKIADEFRVIKRPIIRNALGQGGGKLRNGNLVMVTSAMPAEGKTFTALNLAVSVAMEYDNTVLLIDGDVAQPGLPRLLGIPESPGLLDLLTNDSLDVADALIKTNIEKLSVIPAGSPHRRATELLASEQMGALLQELSTRYPDRIIIFDSPPLLATTEARVLATHMGQIVMVVAAESTSQHTLDQAMATIESCEVVLMMLNKASRTNVGTYGYYADDGGR